MIKHHVMERVGFTRTARRASGASTRRHQSRRHQLGTRGHGLRSRLRENGLSIVVLVLFILTFGAQAVAGMHEYNDERTDHGQAEVGFAQYLSTGHFMEATAENWESEFLQMAAYVLLTAAFFQKGSSESKKLDEPEAVDRDPRKAKGRKDAPGPVRRGGWILRLYENSLSLTFLGLFVVSFVLHGIGGAREYTAEQLQHGGDGVSVLQYMQTARFWFESSQNWQSEFLALLGMVVLSIFLRQRGSPESKPVDAPHAQTGSE